MQPLSPMQGLQATDDSLAEANADKEWLWSVLEDAWADNKRISAALERTKAEKSQVVVECEKIWDIATHRTAEVEILKQKLAQYEAFADAGEEKYVTESR
ncbi:hypothetical protein C0992_004591 [Termitomyces sp. T32_za158]|nr:hypothetical protein C0992_004591 [Termitomyces sp. T32_za158]